MNKKRPAEIEDTFNLQFGNTFKTMARCMMKKCNVGDSTMMVITNQEDWEKFLLSD